MPNPELFVGDSERRTAQPNLARGLADNLVSFISDDPQVDGSARSIRQPQFATQDLGNHSPCFRNLGADIPYLKVQPPTRKPQIAFQQLVANSSDPLILINHLAHPAGLAVR